MPLLVVYTNLKKDSIPDDFVFKASSCVADLLKKPNDKMTVRVHADQIMSHGGTKDPCCTVEVQCIGLDRKNQKRYTQGIGKFIEENLNISQKRFYTIFVDLKMEDVGFDGKTFDEILQG